MCIYKSFKKSITILGKTLLCTYHSSLKLCKVTKKKKFVWITYITKVNMTILNL